MDTKSGFAQGSNPQPHRPKTIPLPRATWAGFNLMDSAFELINLPYRVYKYNANNKSLKSEVFIILFPRFLSVHDYLLYI